MNRQPKIFKTPGGTELSLIDLKGKDYLPVQQRVIWFREEHPKGQIETIEVEFNVDKRYARYKAIIRDADGNVLAHATKMESQQGFGDFVEKAETGAVGRALALCGYGTQFTAHELDEADRIVDAPVEPKTSTKTVATKMAKLMEIGKLMQEKEVTAEQIKAEFGMGSGEMTEQQLEEVISWLASKNLAKVAAGEIDLSGLDFGEK